MIKWEKWVMYGKELWHLFFFRKKNLNITEDEWFNFYKDLWTNETENEIDPEVNDLLTLLNWTNYKEY
jgi:hypothetical protein